MGAFRTDLRGLRARWQSIFQRHLARLVVEAGKDRQVQAVRRFKHQVLRCPALAELSLPSPTHIALVPWNSEHIWSHDVAKSSAGQQ
jgi:hypothetical protein